MAKEWFEQTPIKFQCTECGKCCSGAPGYVWVNDEEIEAIAKQLHLSPKEVRRRYTRQIGHRTSLVEKKADYACIFLKDNRCTIYKARPTQCKTYPYWPSIMKSRAAWDSEASHCEGIREENTVVPLEEIKEKYQKQKEYLF